AGGKGQMPGAGGAGKSARGGGIYLAGGKLVLNHATIGHDTAVGGAGGVGGAAGQLAGQANVSAGAKGGDGASATGGGLYVAGGTVEGSGASFRSDAAIGGAGGAGGKGGLGGKGGAGGAGGVGGAGGAGLGGGIYLGQGTISLSGGSLTNNQASGGAGGAGGSGGAGSSLVAASNISLPGVTQTKSGSVNIPTGTSLLNGTALSNLFHGGPGGAGGAGGLGGNGLGGGVYVAGGMLTIDGATLAGNQADGGQGGTGGKGGQAGMAALIAGIGGGSTGKVGSTAAGAAPAPLGGLGGTGGSGGGGDGGGLYLAAGNLTLLDSTASGNSAHGGAGGTGGTGGAGAYAGGLSGLGGGGGAGGGTATGSAGAGIKRTHEGGSRHHFRHATTGGGSTKVGGFATGGNGGAGGNAGNALGGALYVAGGSLSLEQDTVAANAVSGGSAGAGGLGGKGGSYGLGNGQKGQDGRSGSGSAGAVYVQGGTVNLFNSTVALNTQTGKGAVGGVLQGGGTVKAASTLFAGNGKVDFAGTIDATNSLIQAPDAKAAITGSNNQTGVAPKLDTNGLANNGGPTETILLQSGSPALGQGSNPLHFVTDQRGYGPRTGTGGTDIGAVQMGATAITAAPSATLSAAGVDSVPASASASYQFTVTYKDDAAIEVSTLAGAVVQVDPPGRVAPINASVVSTSAVGNTDPLGNAPSFVVTYQLAAPGGSWSASDNGTYTVTLGGSPVTNVGGLAVPSGRLGTFAVNIPAADHMAITAVSIGSSTSIQAGTNFTATISIEDSQGQVQANDNGSVTIALGSGPSGATLGGTTTVPVKQGVASFSGLAIDLTGKGYSLAFSSAGLAPVAATGTFDVTPAKASKLVVTAQPPATATAGGAFPLSVSAEDAYGNVVTDASGTVTLTLVASSAGAALGGTTSANFSNGVASFSGVTVSAAGTSDTIHAASTGLTGAATSAFTVNPPAGGQISRDAPTQVVVTTAPTATSTSPMTAGSAFSVTVSLEDAQGQVQTGDNGSVTITLVSGPTGGSLGGKTTVQASQGVVTFSGLTLGLASGDYTIRLSSPNVPTSATLALDVAAANPPPSQGGGIPPTGTGTSTGTGTLTGTGTSTGTGTPPSSGGGAPAGGTSPTPAGQSGSSPATGGGNGAGGARGDTSHGKIGKHDHKPGRKDHHGGVERKHPKRPHGFFSKKPKEHPKAGSASKAIHPRDVILGGPAIDIRSHPLLDRTLFVVKRR
ncbi:MAG: beta strand repeat-containing protein, partial [Isosphaeraceae bacterium]